jgi:hypothetical protein
MMLAHDHRLVALALLGSFQKEDTSIPVIDEFKSALIAAHEQALESGMSPGSALWAILDWISQEVRRCTDVPATEG